MNFQEILRNDLSFGFIDSTTHSLRKYAPRLVSNSRSEKVVGTLKSELAQGGDFIFSVAFLTQNALSVLKQALIDFSGSGTIITSNYQNFNTPEVFLDLLKLENVNVRIFTGPSFHAKGYIFRRPIIESYLIGSSNLTVAALAVNHEWNVHFSGSPTGDFAKQLSVGIDYQLKHSEVLTEEWIKQYEPVYRAQASAILRSREMYEEFSQQQMLDAGDGVYVEEIVPNRMQEEALWNLQDLRDSGATKGLIVSATGTGKTILSALDVKNFGPRKMLYIVHREQILDKAISEFKRVLHVDDSEIGKFTGSSRTIGSRLTFATIQTISRQEHLDGIPSDLFDYILIDEVHRSGAETYQRVLKHFEPQFLLGMTATPERNDQVNIFEMFDFNVPYEIRLNAALEMNMLTPFHYYGVTDYTNAMGEVVDETTDLSKLVLPERVNYLLKVIETYRQEGKVTRGLIFCRSVAEARSLSSALNESVFSNGRRIRTVALSGENTQEEREREIRRLESGELHYILSYDIFNEGIDIPSLNQIIMMRQTQSSIVFVQQLGRGLRKHPGKDSVIVIDFIGNYKNNYMIPIALFGDSSLNKDTLRKRLVEAKNSGVLSGVSSVSFDKISESRIFASIESASLDSIRNLQEAYQNLKFELNRVPTLYDFFKDEKVDPVVLATKKGSYLELVQGFEREPSFAGITPHMYQVLRMLSHEILNGKRPHELLILKLLLEKKSVQVSELSKLLGSFRVALDQEIINSALTVLSLKFYKEADQKKYGGNPLVQLDRGNDQVKLGEEFSTALSSSSLFESNIVDIISTGLALSDKRYDWESRFKIGEKYSRKDAARLLAFEGDYSSTIYGYRTDVATKTCPIFVTYHKDDSISESTQYGDHFVDQSIFHWFSRSNRTLQSDEVRRVLNPDFEKHLFVKKDDAEGDDFYYLGRATATREAQDTMAGGMPVVRMDLILEHPVDFGLYHYLING